MSGQGQALSVLQNLCEQPEEAANGINIIHPLDITLSSEAMVSPRFRRDQLCPASDEQVA